MLLKKSLNQISSEPQILGAAMKSIILCFLLLFSLSLSAEESSSETVEVKNEYEGDFAAVELENLAGNITIEEGEKLEYSGRIQATDKDATRAKALAAKVSFATTEEDNCLKIRVEYPVSEHTLFYYPTKIEGRKSASKSRARLIYQGREVTLFADATPAAVQLSCDITLKVPKGILIKVRNCAGKVLAHTLNRDLKIDTSSANVLLTQVSGRSTIQTATGAIALEECKGDYSLNSGTGSIRFKKCDLQELAIHNGSGVIEGDSSTIKWLGAFSGSGRVELDDCTVSDAMKADTGTGIIKMKGDFSHLQALHLQTGTGSITFTTTAFPALDLQVTTGSGRIENRAPVSDKPIGTAVVRSGSGNIKINSMKRKRK